MKKIATLLILASVAFASCETQKAFADRMPAKGVDGRLTRHPDEITLTTKDQKKEFYFLFDRENECIFITEKQDLYNSIADFLPEMKIDDRHVELDGPIIDPFTLFNKEEFEEKIKPMVGNLNGYRICTIFNHQLVPAGMGNQKQRQSQNSQQNQQKNTKKNQIDPTQQ